MMKIEKTWNLMKICLLDIFEKKSPKIQMKYKTVATKKIRTTDRIIPVQATMKVALCQKTAGGKNSPRANLEIDLSASWTTWILGNIFVLCRVCFSWFIWYRTCFKTLWSWCSSLYEKFFQCFRSRCHYRKRGFQSTNRFLVIRTFFGLETQYLSIIQYLRSFWGQPRVGHKTYSKVLNT